MRSSGFISLSILALAAGVFACGSAVFAEAPEFDFKKIPAPGSYGTVIMDKNTKDSKTVKPVLFPHWVHRAKYTCKACHTDLGFPLKANAADIKQSEIEAGKYCGRCHNGTAAFAVSECNRCHSYGAEGGKANMDEALKDLPKNEFGNKIDWAAAIKEGKLKPSGVDGADKLKALDTEIIIPVTKFSPHPPDVLFPHKIHTEQLECSSCHPSIFNEKKGGNPDMNMIRIISGKYCGACHGKVAFPLDDCFRCHSQPPAKAEEPKKDEKKK